jgi:hypothetical protein
MLGEMSVGIFCLDDEDRERNLSLLAKQVTNESIDINYFRYHIDL